jgi:iron complex outermembrane receptor protein
MKSFTPVKSVLALAISGALATGASLASAQALEEVIVTAQKREQSVMDVPISIATVSGERLTSLFEGGADIRALSTRVPNLFIESSNGRVAPRFYIRGLGNSDFDLAASQPVSVIFDEVVKENTILKSFPIFDMERVEVLRGPQGSLFGRNTTAGIVKFDSYKPTEETTGHAKVDVGDLGTTNFEGALGGGITDSIAGRVAVLYQGRDDYIDNGFTGQNDVYGEIEEKAIKGFLSWDASDNLDFLLGAHYRDLDGTSALFRANVLGPGNNDLNNNFDRETVYFDDESDNPQAYNNTGVNLKFNYDFGPVTLTSISAYEDADGESRGDIDGGFSTVDGNGDPVTGPGLIIFPSSTQDGADTLEQYTQEFRVSNNDVERLYWQAGVFYFNSNIDITTTTINCCSSTNTLENEAYAIFGQADYDLADAWTLTAGLRWSYDDLDFTDNTQGGFREDVNDDQVSGNLSLAYTTDNDTMVWGKVASGFRGPSIQGRDVRFGDAPSVADSETITSFEVGFKSQFWNDRARLSAAIFYYEVDDIQLTAVGGAGNTTVLLNADEGTGQGFELDFEMAVNEYFNFTLGYAYADTEIDDDQLSVGTCAQCTVTDPISSDGLALVDGNPFVNAPERTASFTATVRYPVAGGEVFAFTDWGWQGNTNFLLYETEEFNVDDQFEGGLRAGYRTTGDKYEWEVAGFARNITDEENVQGGIDFNNNTGFVNEPRIYGVSASIGF